MAIRVIALDIAKSVFQYMVSTRPDRLFFVVNCDTDDVGIEACQIAHR